MTATAEVARLAPADLDGAVEVAARAFPVANAAAIFRARIAGCLERAPDGAWVAREDGRVVGVALGEQTDGIWVLVLLAVDATAQSGGLGRVLLERALATFDGARGGFITASDDPRALRLYARAGFSLRPCVVASGVPDRAALPAGLAVRDSGLGDVERTVALDRAVRGGARPLQHAELLASGCRLRLAAGDRGYVVSDGTGLVQTLAASDPAAAQALMWSVLAETAPGGEACLRWLGSGQDWAIEVAVRAGLTLAPWAPYFARGQLGTLAPFVPSGAYS